MSRLLSIYDAVERFVPDGASIVMGTSLESLIPFAAGHELIRRGRRGLELIGPISDILFDQLIGAGCVRKVTAAWVGNVSQGLGHNYRRAMEQGVPRALELEEHSNFTIGLGLLAAAMGVPYMPTRTLIGSDMLEQNSRLRLRDHKIVHVSAIEPDVAILHVQRADEQGHAHCWGNLGISKEAGMAARSVVITAEEIVPTEVILSDPNRVLLPPHRVRAVCHVPGGAHPSPVQGHYGRDNEHFAEYHQRTRNRDGFEAWLSEWVLGVPERATYLEKLGERWSALKPRDAHLAAPVDYA